MVSTPVVALNSSHVALNVAVAVQPASTSPPSFSLVPSTSDDIIVTAQLSNVFVCFILWRHAL